MSIKKILYIGWIGHHNIGDDLLLDIFKKMLLNCDSSLIIHEYDPTSERNINLKHYDLIILGGGSLLRNSNFVMLCLKANKMNIPTIIWGSGTDIRNKEHAEKLINYYHTSKNNTLFTNKKMLERNIINTARNSSLTGVRGNITKFLLNSNNVKVIGDPGIIFSKVFHKLPPNDDLKNLNLDKEKTVLVNWGTSYNRILGNSEKTVEEKLKIAITKLLDQGYKVVIYPIWNKDIPVCTNFANKINHENLLCIDKLYNVYQLAKLIQSCKFTINLKLHACILSMTYGKPFVCLGYGLKCYDYVESINSTDLFISTDKVTGHRILETVKYINNNYENIQERFNKEINKYYQLQLDYIKEINNFLKN
ncbi:polysaccharide pyruvyl transferase family protein [Oceanirhabdus sp. W0125-5]|uniref:polysaccharide pyruvyl transferase family protein n=1 Tax=Oceanirhabdus sp. W0125-5 TaxID=2999116 RepID=UPI0022F33F10|nr:polysaccharide pyruvyl transferase family protein [Oceanirhabdus sp. W0125-5]WBW96638.1 polysaccharide pyruvyl transferase family protein [Oceanirhabdus sp. W0125-5]